MNKFKSICVYIGDPFRTQQPAAAKAAAVAARSGAKLTLLNTFLLPQPNSAIPLGDTKRLMTSTIRQRRQALNAVAKRLRRNGLSIRTVVRWDYPPHEAIVRFVLETKPDLLFAESQRHNRLMRLVLANTDWELIRHCPCPLWFVRSPKLPKRLNILVAVDPAHSRAKPARLDDRLLAAAGAVSHNIGGDVDVIHTYLQPRKTILSPMVGPISVPLSSEAARLYYERLRKSVDKLADRYGVAPLSRHMKAGEPHLALVASAAELRAHVLVMGAVSRSGLDRLFIGSTAERVIDHVDCDVLIVKPAGVRNIIPRRRPKLPKLYPV